MTPVPFHHPSRLHVADSRPCWLGLVAVLPDLSLRPTSPRLTAVMGAREGESEHYTACVMAPRAEEDGTWDGGFSWAWTRPLNWQEVNVLLGNWERDPEGALHDWFGRVLPRAKLRVEGGKAQESVGSTSASVEDLGL